MAKILKDIKKEQKDEIALRGLQYGSITVVIQDGIVIQVDRTSKSRVDYSELDNVKGGEGI